MNIIKPHFDIEERLRKDYPNIERLLSLMDIHYLSESYRTLENSCPILVSDAYKIEHNGKIYRSKICLFPQDQPIDSIWYGENIKKAIKKGIIRLGLPYDTCAKYGPNIRFELAPNPFKRLLTGLTKFPPTLEIGVYLQPKQNG